MSPAHGSPDYQAQMRQARSRDPADRLALARDADVAPELLVFLAADVAEEVRRQIASDDRTPGHADMVLARDDAESVRQTVANKVVARVPANGTRNPEPIQKITLDVLMTLARDRSLAVREAMSAAVKDLQHAPNALVRHLAFDPEISVAEPVLAHSPALNDRDLVDAVNEAPAPGAKTVIARRPDLAPAVADAVARSEDVAAIGSLLANPSAQIREETLDLILDQAPEHPDWHPPLVHRRQLSGRAIERLAKFVALSLVDVLRQRPDIDPNTASTVASLLKRRIEEAETGEAMESVGVPDPTEDGAQAGAAAVAGSAEDADAEAEALLRARRLNRRGRLGVDDVDDAIFAGDRPFVVAALSVLAGQPVDTVDRIIRSQSARGVVALAWSAKLPMSMAIKLQVQTARIARERILRGTLDESYPLTDDEMRWQLNFFGATGV